MTVNVENSKLAETELVYLADKLTANSIEPDENMIQSITEMLTPNDKINTPRFFGLINYV